MIALLPLRLALGLIFTIHGYLKLFSPTYGPAKFAKYLEDEKVPLPKQAALIIGVLEFVGGLCLLAGFYGRVAGGLLAIHVFLALVTVAPKKGFTKLPDTTGWEYELVLLVALVVLVLSGATPYSLDSVLAP